jgi:hypothetical protein
MRTRYSSLSYLLEIEEKIKIADAIRARFLADVDKKIAILCGVAIMFNAISVFVR